MQKLKLHAAGRLVLLCLIGARATAFGQMVYLGLTPGQSTQAQADAALGRPVRQINRMSFEYPAQQATGRIEVEYASGIVDRIQVFFAQPVSRAEVVQRVLQSRAPETRKSDSSGLIYEFFGDPLFVSLTYSSANESRPVSINYYSRSLYEIMLRQAPAVSAATLTTVSSSQTPQTVTSDAEFRVRLITPVSARSSRGGDRVATEVLGPASYAGGVIEGAVTEVAGAGSSGASSLSIMLPMFHRGQQVAPVTAEIRSVKNSRGRQSADEEGRAVRISSNGAGTMAAGGEGAIGSIPIIQLTSDGPNVSFAAGSEFVLRVRGLGSGAPALPSAAGGTGGQAEFPIGISANLPRSSSGTTVAPTPGQGGSASTPSIGGNTTPAPSVPATADANRNLALNRPTRESSIYNDLPTDSARGVNGNTGDFFSTKQEFNPWWQVDLGANYALTEVRITNRTDCCSERSRTLRVLLSTNGNSWQTVYTHNGSVWGADGRPLVVSIAGGTARYVRLQLAEDNIMNICEVEVYGSGAGSVAVEASPLPATAGTASAPATSGTTSAAGSAGAGLRNLALNRPTRESSIYNDFPTDSARGVNGNSDDFFNTKEERNPWWEVDLGANFSLTEARITNRTDCCMERARTLRVLVSTDGSAWQTVYVHDGSIFGGADKRPLIVPLGGRTARYVRLQLAESNIMNIAEVEVYGR
jgi:hypothetical protein